MPLIERLLKSGKPGGAGIPAKIAGSGMGMFSGGIVNIGTADDDDVKDVVPNNCGPVWPSGEGTKSELTEVVVLGGGVYG